VLEDETRHHAVALEREVAARRGQLPPGDVPALGEPSLAELQGGEHEQVRVLAEPLLAQPDAIHDPVAKRQLRQLVSG
jgi:hypothetical protein